MGAARRQIVTLVARQGAGLTLLGIAIGTAGSFALRHAMAGLLYGVSSTDAPTIVAMLALLATVAFVAMYFPVRRALAIDPVRTIRGD